MPPVIRTKFGDCNRNNTDAEEGNLNFIATSYRAISALSASSGVQIEWIYGWAITETGCGTAFSARANGNHFGMKRGTNWLGQIPCGDGTSPIYACFADFAASANAAINSSRIDIVNEGRFVVSEFITANPNMSVAAIFQSIADMGHDPGNAKYGASVSGRVGDVSRRIDCLKSGGFLK